MNKFLYLIVFLIATISIMVDARNNPVLKGSFNELDGEDIINIERILKTDLTVNKVEVTDFTDSHGDSIKYIKCLYNEYGGDYIMVVKQRKGRCYLVIQKHHQTYLAVKNGKPDKYIMFRRTKKYNIFEHPEKYNLIKTTYNFEDVADLSTRGKRRDFYSSFLAEIMFSLEKGYEASKKYLN